jgi:hypothetical protein
MKISELLDGIRKSDLVLPEFQREYVWTREQAKQLLVSLVKGYPVGSLLFWKTDKPPDLKNLPQIPEKLGLISVILDGQQRLTRLPGLYGKRGQSARTRICAHRARQGVFRQGRQHDALPGPRRDRPVHRDELAIAAASARILAS